MRCDPPRRADVWIGALVLLIQLHVAVSLHQPSPPQLREAAELRPEFATPPEATAEWYVANAAIGAASELLGRAADRTRQFLALAQVAVTPAHDGNSSWKPIDSLGLFPSRQGEKRGAALGSAEDPDESSPILDAIALQRSRRLVWHKTATKNGTSWELVDLGLKFPEGADIWNTSLTWVNVSLRHPAGVVSNVYGRKVLWADVHFLSIELLYIVSLIAYPASFVFLLLLTTILVSVCMAASSAHTSEAAEPPDGADRDRPIVLNATTLSPYGKRIFLSWSVVCRTIPMWMVWGMPFFLIILTYPMPQEVFMVLVVYTSVFIFSNSMYMVFFCPFIMADMHKNASQRTTARLDPMRHAEEQEIVHWVVFPNYNEDIETISGSLETVGQSGIARTQICVLLAMEERDPEARAKALHVKAKFAGRFKELLATYHPQDLPNDPPGKASNMAWAFKWLVNYVEDQRQDPAKVLITVADADSDLHRRYFEQLSTQYVEAPESERKYCLFQAPVFHVKNYHRMPMLLVPSAMFTAMQELATLADPNAIRFPYSTYSMPLLLGKHVGGWDAEWIAEDWHMGLKCFLLTLGRARVQPIALPTVNYVPEDTTWFGTLYARWSQAKRHALGFSDVSYYFMVLPLLFCQLSRRPRGDFTLQDFWKVFFHGLSYVIRLINAHALLGSLTLYAIMAFFLKSVLRYAFQDMRHFGPLLDRSASTCGVFFGATILTSCLTSLLFQVIYSSFLKDRMEPASPAWQKLFSYRVVHFIYTTAAALIFGVVSTVSLGLLVQMTAVKVLFSTSFEYETAMKPTKDSRLS
mmetsp:Transcript_64132/g.187663  ORF Transcript_64132/g.187663 Transcript_64132/m.187663 type:complete len:809 (-) Transcript_64132:105-2531(-)